jgi:mycothiol synthase
MPHTQAQTLTPPALPAGLGARPLTLADAEAVVAVMHQTERRTLGRELVEAADLVADWQRPSFDLATESVGVLDADGALVAYAEVYAGERAEVFVADAVAGRGVGTALLRWTWAVAQARGSAVVGQTVPDTHAEALALFAAHGYEHRWTSWILRFPDDVPLPAVTLPAGVVLRPLQPGRDEQAAFDVVETAFGEWPDRTPSTYGDWAARTLSRPGFEPWQLLLAVEAESVVGVAALSLTADGEGWVDQLAVARSHRGRGLGAALLGAGFAELRTRGATSANLSTDSRTGALGLYEHVGMRTLHAFENWAKRF